ncbi:MAG: Fic family protein [Deltaproteobacteria bacterium]|nr:Fic family protein [Deltaproteobacteria bacterium]
MPRISGLYDRTSVGGEEVAAFIPAPLPPSEPPLATEKLVPELQRAEAALARLELASAMVPSISWFLYSFVRKEAVVSSQIEGTQATLIDLLAFEAEPAADSADVQEICNYLDAVRFARDQLSNPQGLPLTVRLLNETHRRLMKGVRGQKKLPGEVRQSQNWIGGTPGKAVFVPPPPHAVPDLLGELERFIHADSPLAPLVRAGLVHVQFETIHPYLDGNGRLGRLLIALLLEHWRLLSQPLLYLSSFFKQHRAEYYRRLGAVRSDGDFEGWLAFFLEGVTVVANEAVAATRDLFAMVTADREKVLAAKSSSLTAARLFELLPEHPIVTISGVGTLLKTTKPTATKAVKALVDADVLVERAGQGRARAFAYGAYLERLAAGTELVTR